MKKRQQKIKIAIEERVALWASTEAARRGTSLSKFVESLLKERIRGSERHENSIPRALAPKSFMRKISEELTEGVAAMKDHRKEKRVLQIYKVKNPRT